MLFAAFLLFASLLHDIKNDVRSDIRVAESLRDSGAFEEAAETLERSYDDIPEFLLRFFSREIIRIAKAHASLGDAQRSIEGEWRRTGELYTRTLTLVEQASKTDRVDRSLAVLRGALHSSIAEAAENSGDLYASLEGYRNAISLLDEAMSRKPTSGVAAEWLGDALLSEARILVLLQRWEQAKAAMDDAIERLKSIPGLQHDGSLHASSILVLRSSVHRNSDQPQSARQDAEQAIEIARELVRESPGYYAELALIEALESYALALGELGARRAKLANLTKALEILEDLEETEVVRSVRWRLSLSLIIANDGSENPHQMRRAISAFDAVTPLEMSQLPFTDAQVVFSAITMGLRAENHAGNIDALLIRAQRIIEIGEVIETTFGVRGIFVINETAALSSLASYKNEAVLAHLLRAEKRLLSVPESDPFAFQVGSLLESVRSALANFRDAISPNAPRIPG
ncbi:MAG: hypothetical protein AAFN79_19800 [Pseudomonadota bacterium]